MADETITGCYNKETGEIVFTQTGDEECEYSGCYVVSGVHAGQIAVEIIQANCDDVFYGCIDAATGDFNLTIPDSCCSRGFSPCWRCVAEKPDPPPQIKLDILNIDTCFPDNCTSFFNRVVGSDFSGIYNNIPNSCWETGCGGTPCRYNKILKTVDITTIRGLPGSPCDLVIQRTLHAQVLWQFGLRVRIKLSEIANGGFEWFEGEVPDLDCAEFLIVPNNKVIGDCSNPDFTTNFGYNGRCIVTRL